jgi:four helix bundle protein
MGKKEIEVRLIGNATSIITLCRLCKFDVFTFHLSKQIVRSSSSAALNYGEAQSAESKKDFVHKMSIVLKELRETGINLKIMESSHICNDHEFITKVIDENNELIAIFQSSVNTVKTRM